MLLQVMVVPGSALDDGSNDEHGGSPAKEEALAAGSHQLEVLQIMEEILVDRRDAVGDVTASHGD